MGLKRIFDLSICILVFPLLMPIILITALFVFLEDRNKPFYFSRRIGKEMKIIKVIKLRSMIVDADKTIIRTTTSGDIRVTKVGKVIRKYKIDELPQFLNVIIGDMSLVGPRPNVWENGVEFYSKAEMHLLSAKPGITDFSSIIFSDLAEITAGQKDPDQFYNQIIRPWKSRFGLLYVEKHNILLDMKLLFCTFINLFNRQAALMYIASIVKEISDEDDLYIIAKRKIDLY